MADLRSLVISNGTTSQIQNTDTLIVGTKVDAASGQTLSIGDVNATSITVGSASISTNFPGPVTLTGDVTTVGGTTFTTDATFEGNVTFGNANTDTVDFVAKVDSNIVFTGLAPTYGIQNMIDPTNPQDAATKAYVDAASGAATLQTAYQNGNTITTSVGEGAVTIAGDQNLLFTSSGQVGVGTASPNEKLTVSGALSVGEQGSAPSATAAFGKLYAKDGANNARPYWLDDTGQSYNLTLDRFNTLTAGASVAIDASPALPIFNSVTLNQNTTFTTSNLGNGRSASVRIVCDGTTRTLTWPAGWTWLGSGAPTSLNANDVGYLAITAYGATDADVVAAWSYENAPVSVTGSGVDNQISVWSGTYTQDGSASFTFDGTTFKADSAVTFNDSGAAVDFRVEGDTDANLLFVDGSADFVGIGTASPSAKLTVSGGISQSSGAVALTANAASSFTTSSGALTLTSAAAATWSTSAGNLALSGAANLELAAGTGSEVVVNQAGANVDFRVESDTNAHALFVDASANHVGIGTSNVSADLFNIGTGATTNFSIAVGGKIHTYGGAAPIDGQVLIGNTAQGRFDAATITAGSGVSITNGAGTITIAATGTGGTVTSIDVSGGTTGLTFSGGPVTTSGTITMAGTLDADNGGTGQSSYTAGDLLYATGVTTLSKLAIGSANTVLRSNGSAPSWGSVVLTTDVSGTLPVGNGGTGTSTQFTAGSVVFAGASGVYAQDNANLFWDDATDSLGIGTALPTAALSIAEKLLVNSNGRITKYDNSAPTDGQLLIGDTAAGYLKKATLTAGTNIAITNGAGSVTVAVTGTVAASSAVEVVLNTTTNSVAAGDACYVSAGGTANEAIATAASTARVVGISKGATADRVYVAGIIEDCNFVGSLSLAAGQPVFLSAASAGLLTNVAPSASGEVIAEVGIITTVNTAGGGAAAADVLWQPKSIVVL